MHTSVEERVKLRIIKQGRGWCFASIHFQDLGNNMSIRKALSNLQKKQIIRRLTQGIYDYPIIHDVLGEIPPNLNKVALAITEKNGVSIQPTGATAANLLGLSNQVPGKIQFLTDGISKKFRIGKQEIVFKKASQKTMAASGTKGGLLIQGLKNIGKNNINQTILNKVNQLLKNSKKEEVLTNLKFAPAWIRTLVLNLIKTHSNNSQPLTPEQKKTKRLSYIIFSNQKKTLQQKRNSTVKLHKESLTGNRI